MSLDNKLFIITGINISGGKINTFGWRNPVIAKNLPL
jgi:hypothetical protein